MSDYGRLFKGSTIRFATLLVSIFIAFLMMPFIIHSVGDRWYGLWVVIGGILGFYSMMDLGLSSATQRYLSHALPREDHRKFNQYFNTSILVYSLISVVVLIITVTLVVFAAHFVDDPTDLDVFRIIIAIMGATLAISFPFYVINGIIVANMRYDISSLLMLAKIIIRAICIYLALSHGYGIIAMAMITSATDFIANLFLTHYALKLAPWVKLSRSMISRECARELFSFSTYSLIGSSADKIRMSTAPLIISWALSLSSVTLYSIAKQFMSYFKQAISSLLVVTLPLFTKNISLNDTEKSKHDFLFATKLACYISTVGGGIIILLCEPFITIWMGPDYASSALTTMILVGGTAYVSCQQPSMQYFFASSTNKYHTWMSVIETIATLILGITLVEEHGINAVAFAIVAPQVLMKTFVQPTIICRLIGLSLSGYWSIILRTMVATAITMLVFSRFDFTDGYLQILISACLIGALHSLLTLYIIFTRDDRALIFNFVRTRINSRRQKGAVHESDGHESNGHGANRPESERPGSDGAGSN